MAWYYGTFSCEHEGRVNIIGPVKDRQRKADYRFSGLCEECYKIQLQEEKKQRQELAEQKSAEMELPQLSGTPKQIQWAMELRYELFNKFNEVIDDKEYFDNVRYFVRRKLPDFSTEDLIIIRDYILCNITDSNYFINVRSSDIIDIIISIKDKALRPKIETSLENEILSQIEAEALVIPEDARTNTPVKINLIDDIIVATFERNDNFMSIVKGLGYAWENKRWEKRISQTTGSAQERIAELGNKLLEAGFPVKIYDKDAREKAINAEYEPEHTRWIYLIVKGDYQGWLSIRWSGKNDRLYSAARKIKNSKWDSVSVVVSLEYFAEIEEFARLFGFKFTEAAQSALNKFKETITVTTISKSIKPEEKDGLREILKSGSEIIDDLKD